MSKLNQYHAVLLCGIGGTCICYRPTFVFKTNTVQNFKQEFRKPILCSFAMVFWSRDCPCKVKDRLTPPTHTLSRLGPINTDKLTNHLPQVYTIWNRAPHTEEAYKGPILICLSCQTKRAAYCYAKLKSSWQDKCFGWINRRTSFSSMQICSKYVILGFTTIIMPMSLQLVALQLHCHLHHLEDS